MVVALQLEQSQGTVGIRHVQRQAIRLVQVVSRGRHRGAARPPAAVQPCSRASLSLGVGGRGDEDGTGTTGSEQDLVPVQEYLVLEMYSRVTGDRVTGEGGRVLTPLLSLAAHGTNYLNRCLFRDGSQGDR